MSAFALRRFESLDQARADWERLEAKTGNIFSTWEWARTWWEFYGERRQPHIYAAGPSGQAADAIIPLYLARQAPMRVFRFIGHGPSDELAPVTAPDRRAETAALLRNLLGRWRGPTMLLAERLPAGVAWSDLLGAEALRSEDSSLLRVAGVSWEEWLSTRTGHFRSRMRSAERKLERAHQLDVRLVDSRDALDDVWDTFVQLHNARWRGASSAFAGRRGDFQRTFAQRAASRGWLRLWIAYLDGRPVAALLNYRLGDVEWGVQGGRDPGAQRTGVANVLFMRVVKSCFDEGLSTFRLGRGEELLKGRVASEAAPVVTLAAGTPALVNGAAAAFRWRGRVPERPRELISRALRIS